MSYLTIALLVIGYIYVFIPLLLMISLCLCLPFAIIFIMYLSNTNQSPANEAAIRNLNIDNYDPEKHQGEPNCSICTVEYVADERIVLLRCDDRHFFHEECIGRWLRINANCPICRSSLLSSSYGNN
mmetsp:Transcript_33338/g.6026  ORF Transcript_33338/g.6026 Transcript_33338/m.6026 type:complete len:127 (+) Transcript_33338:430-810(+)